MQSQKKATDFQPDDVIILQGYPKAWQGKDLLNVKLAVKIPQDVNNSMFSRATLSQLLENVAPEIHRQTGHSVAYIGQTEITPVPPDASGRNSSERKSSSSRKSALIALGAVLGGVLLVTVIIIVWYRRKKKRYTKISPQE